MNRPWQIAVAFGACLAVVLAAMGWISLELLRLDRAQAEANRQAQREENVRLALWRMESALGPVIAQESAQPYFAYEAFYPADRAYSHMFNKDPAGGEILLPSPILVPPSPYVLLHFQFGPGGEVSSPQAPTGRLRAMAEAGYTNRDAIAAAAARLERLKSLVAGPALAAAMPREDRVTPVPTLDELVQAEPQQGQQAMGQNYRNVKEFQARTQVSQTANTSVQAQGLNNPAMMYGNVRQGVMRPVWLGDTLLLARRVNVNGREYVQGAWLDWPAIRRWLLQGARDLVPEADLVPVTDGAGEDASRRLAALPARLVAGTVPVDPTEGVSPTVVSLAVAWACVLVAAAAVGVLLVGTVALSERRADFVSSVTHELRTPLTTFRMYSEMLAEGMVTDEAKRRRYLDTLRIEAQRLSHLVENVLAYARLERGRARGRMETVAIGDLAARVRDRLADRARQAGMDLVVETPEGQADLAVRADTAAVEQILFNLVDNACKYAAMAADRRVHLAAAAADGAAVLKVCDHGPGISAADARRLFRPFSKSAREAANSAPGVGLGLALSRRLAREMGGDLMLQPAAEGACFVLRLVRA